MKLICIRMHAPTINYVMEREVAITLCFQLPGISVPFENYTVCVMTSTSLKQRDYIIMQKACFQMELKSLVCFARYK